MRKSKPYCPQKTRGMVSIQATDGQNTTKSKIGGGQLTKEELHTILKTRARKNSLKLYWGSSVVDLMKLLDLDSGEYPRELLAMELGVNVGPVGTSQQNIALHKALMMELANNNGKVPGKIVDNIGI
jgi:Domain of unknown function (DUF3597)